MRNGALKEAALRAAGAAVPLPLWDALTGVDWALPYYHMVSDEAIAHVSHLYRYRSAGEFTADVEFFCRHYRPIALEEFLAAVRANGRPPARSFLLTFDDGFREMHDVVAPILKAKGVPAVFFLTSASVDNRALIFHQKISLLIAALRAPGATAAMGAQVSRRLAEAGMVGDDAVSQLKGVDYAHRAVLDACGEICDVDFARYLAEQQPYLTSEQVRGLLADGFAVGAHSVDHPRYGDLPLAEQLTQTRDSMRFLQERFGPQPRAFAFPHHDTDVGQAFFEQVFGDSTVEVSFGTGGRAFGAWPGHFQRFSMEKRAGSARQLVSRHYAAHGWHRLRNR